MFATRFFSTTLVACVATGLGMTFPSNANAQNTPQNISLPQHIVSFNSLAPGAVRSFYQEDTIIVVGQHGSTFTVVPDGPNDVAA
jgi:hypothetical protein